MLKRYFVLILFSLLVIFALLLANKKNLFTFDSYEIIQLITSDPYNDESYLIYSNSDGKIIGNKVFAEENGVSISALKQKNDIVYFGSYPQKSTIQSYNYKTHSIEKLGKISTKYENINPYSENLIITLNNGFSEDMQSYNTGFCYLERDWKCLEMESEDFIVVNGIVFNEKIFLHTVSVNPSIGNSQELVKIYDKDFNFLSEVSVTSLGLEGSIVHFYKNANQLFLLGMDLISGEFSAIEVDSDLKIIDQRDYPESHPSERELCIPNAFLEQEEGLLYVELVCQKKQSSTLSEQDNLLIKIDFDDLGNKENDILFMGNNLVRGADFSRDIILLQDGKIRSEDTNVISLYTADFQMKSSIEIEKFHTYNPTLIDIFEMKIE